MIFITGCNGLIGSFIARQLLSQGEKILALRRKNSDMSLLKDIENQIQWIEGDIMDTEVLNFAIKQCDTIVHAAAIISFSPSERELMYKINVEGTANVVNAALINNVKKFCHVSSVAALGRKKGETTVTEKILWEDSENNSHYAKSKYLAELEVWRGIEEGLKAFIICPSVVLGPGNWENGSTKLFKYIFNKNRFYTKGIVNYVDVRDVATIVSGLLSKNIVGEKFIVNAGRVYYKELFSIMAENFKVPAPKIEAQRWLAEIVWRLERIRTIFSASEPLLTKETARLSDFSYDYKNEKIKEVLNYQFVKLSDTIMYSCNELKSRYVNK